MNSTAEKPVLVIGDDMRIFLSVVRSLGRAGKIIHAFPLKCGEPALVSKYVNHQYWPPNYDDNPNGWSEALISLLLAENFSLVIPCVDPAIITLDLHRSQISGQRIAIPSEDSMTACFDKLKTHELCEALEIPTTRWAMLGESDTAKCLVSRFGLPIVVKPRRSYWPDTGRTHEDVLIAESEQELRQFLSTISNRSRFLVESYFQGNGTGVSVLCQEGEILQAFQHRRLREGWGGCSSFRISERVDSRLRAAVGRICHDLGHTGVCMFEFRVNHDNGTWILIEINSRFWGSLPLPLSLGLDYPRWLFELMVEGKTHTEQNYALGVRSRNILLDANNLLKRLRRNGMTSLGQWVIDAAEFASQPVHWIRGKEKTDSFALDDVSPAVEELMSLFMPNRERRPAKRKLPGGTVAEGRASQTTIA